MPLRQWVPPTLGLALVLAPGAGRAFAQVSLADDIILAQKGGEGEGNKKGLNKGGERSKLGREPGSNAGPFRRVPGSSAVLIGGSGAEGLRVVPGSIVRPGSASSLNDPSRGDEEPGRGLFQSGERRSIAPPSPIERARAEGPSPSYGDLDIPGPEDEGPPGGLTLDQAIELLVRDNQDLRTKFFEIPLAQADILTAGLRENPLFFYDTTGVPYGSYAQQRPGEIEHSLSVVYPIGAFSGKRKARRQVAVEAKRVLEAQYQDAVRLQIDSLYEDYVAVLAARDAVRAARRGVELLDRQLDETKDRVLIGDEDAEELEDLRIERETTAMLLDDEQARYQKARRELGALLNLPVGSAEGLELRGTLAVEEPVMPTPDELVTIALRCRPDLVAHRLGIGRARADARLARADRIPDPYFLYMPWSYTDNSKIGLNSISTWGMGVFVSIPLFNRNQGNVERARLNIEQSRSELVQREREVIEEVLQALADFRDTHSDLQRLRRDLMPALRRKRARAQRRFEEGKISASDYLNARRDHSSLVRYARDTMQRHRRNMLTLNTVVGHRVMP